MPIISIAMIAAVYGLQALIFILKREFMLVGWMIIYILAWVLKKIAVSTPLISLSTRQVPDLLLLPPPVLLLVHGRLQLGQH